MTRGTTTSPCRQEDRTIIVAVGQEEYGKIVGWPQQFRAWLGCGFRRNPDNYPKPF